MICCKCKKPIERSYGRVTDLGNYCRECAMQNEIEATKVNNQFVADINKKLNRLAELEYKLENGTLIQLPCKVGDRIWCIINKKHIFGRRIKELIFKKNGWWIQTVDRTGWADMERFYMQEFNKTVFLTKPEAEAKLKELKGENNE